MLDLSRRKMLLAGTVFGALSVAGCAKSTNPTTGAVTYGLDPAVVAIIQSGVLDVASYTPAIESIASVAAGLFGPGYAGIVTVGSAAVNALESALESLLANLPAGGRLAVHSLGKRFGATPSGVLKGYVKTPNGYVPVFAQ